MAQQKINIANIPSRRPFGRRRKVCPFSGANAPPLGGDGRPGPDAGPPAGPPPPVGGLPWAIPDSMLREGIRRRAKRPWQGMGCGYHTMLASAEDRPAPRAAWVYDADEMPVHHAG
jgi:hypothetical protein